MGFYCIPAMPIRLFLSAPKPLFRCYGIIGDYFAERTALTEKP